MPVSESKSATAVNVILRAFASATIAAASGCSLPWSRLAAHCRIWSAWKGGTACTSRNAGRPSVSVPVLSTTSVSTWRRASIASASRNRTPCCAARPVATMIVIGVARPSAHGQAMISTATALSTACVHEGAGPNRPQPKNVSTATDNTASTNQYATVSAMRCIGARERCACATSCTICASMLSSPSRSARTTRLPVPLSVAPITLSPTVLPTGTGSPVSIDSSIEERPSITVPSTGTFSPGRTRTRSPGWSAAISTSSS